VCACAHHNSDSHDVLYRSQRKDVLTQLQTLSEQMQLRAVCVADVRDVELNAENTLV
jgi:hypothetical protein